MRRSESSAQAATADSGTAPTQVERAAATPRRHTRTLQIIALVVLLGSSCVLSLCIGAKPIPLDAVWNALVAPTGIEDDMIVRELRAPRTAIGALVGAALGLAGALTQGHTRNPIADPGILGITHGAGLAIVLATYALEITSLHSFIWFGFAGAALGAVTVFAVGSAGRGGPTPLTLVLAGAAISALLQAITFAVVLLDQRSLDAFRFWKVGSIAVAGFPLVLQVLPFLVIGLALGLAGASGLNALVLGDDVARSLGHHVQGVRVLGILAITILVGASVAVCGPIGFVGLIVPHVVRVFTGPDHRWLLPFSALAGAVLVLLADTVGRVVARPGEIEVGVMLALIGAPFFIVLVRRRKLVRL
ncbi:FecCD family ABC transporter permease [Nocardia sp. NPDC058519]|uniref:FecCD family ABC transporter permease n=1 Tax=Nocardia sp. NPDC058519 TaxID=3346535 RepID=UPI00365EA8CC